MKTAGTICRIVLLTLCCSQSLLSWGRTGHAIINLKGVHHLPSTMARLKADSLFYQNHASDADNRKITGDTSFFNEAERHYIDIDGYPDFQHLPHSRDSVVALYGWETVKGTGTLPWATIMTLDSLTDQIARGDFPAADQSMSDLGHYVADGHQPLHCTENYDGWATNNGGIHSRYESGMINAYQASLTILPDSARYIDSPLDFIFAYILRANGYVTSIMNGDTQAKLASGWSGSGTPPASYYSALWQQTGSFTKQLFQDATLDLASLWYTAWVNSQTASQVIPALSDAPVVFRLDQNWPNPFNPGTSISFEIGSGRGDLSEVSLKIYDVLGREVATLMKESRGPGHATVFWNASDYPGGIYFYRLEGHGGSVTKKMLLIR